MTEPEPQKDRRERTDPPTWRPIPDPTSLTTEALTREVAVLRELIETKIDALTALADSRIEDIRRYYDTLLNERDSRYRERFEAAQKAIDNAAQSVREALEAALEATKESVGKSELSTLKQADATFVKIDALQAAMGKVIPREESDRAWSEIDRRLADHDRRLTAQETIYTTKSESQTDLRGWVIAIIALIGLVVTLVITFSSKTGTG